MPIDRSRAARIEVGPHWSIQVVAIAAVTAIILSIFVPIFAAPFVNILPYVNTVSMVRRAIIPAFSLGLPFALSSVSRPSKEKKLLAIFWRQHRLKDRLAVVAGFAMFVISGAVFSANIMGILVLVFPSTPFSASFQVHESQRKGSRYQSTELVIAEEGRQERQELVLSRRIFGRIPDIQPGDTLLVTGVQGWAGSYVKSFTVSHRPTEAGSPPRSD